MTTRATGVAIAVSLGVALAVSSSPSAHASYADPVIESKEPETIVPSPGKVVRVTAHGKYIGTVGAHPRWQEYWHIWIRNIGASGVAGEWTLCSRPNGCVLTGFNSSQMSLEIMGSTWAWEQGSKFQFHYFLGLGDDDQADPSLNKYGTRMSGWSNTVSWQVTSTPPGILYVPPRPPPGPITTAEPPFTSREIAETPIQTPGLTARQPDACAPGYVWREANAADHVCVAPSARDRTRTENAESASHTNPAPNNAGPPSCVPGYVWREAFAGDYACVRPQSRDIVRRENAAGPSHRAK